MNNDPSRPQVEGFKNARGFGLLGFGFKTSGFRGLGFRGLEFKGFKGLRF